MLSRLRTLLSRTAAREFGRLGGRARAEKARASIRARTRQINRELGRPDDWRLA